MLAQAQTEITVETDGRGLYEFTADVARWVGTEAPPTGLLTIYLRHTSASLLIQENADPDVLADLDAFFAKIVPEDTALYRHVAEGADDMPGHIRAALTQTQLAVPVRDGKLLLGTYQGIFVFEHRHKPMRRQVVLHLIGE